MTDLQNYERLFFQKAEGKLLLKKILFLFLYVSWFCLWTVIMLRRGINAPMLLFIPLTTAALVWLTWSYTQTELEYTVAAGTFYLARIYGKKKRKELVEADLSSALLIAPNTADNQKKVQEYAPAEVLFAASSTSAENVWLMLFEPDPSERILLYVEMDEEMLRVLRHTNPRITSREKLASQNLTNDPV